MQQTAKQFAQQLNKVLDDMEVPTPIKERSVILSKMVNIPKQQAWSLLEGHVLPDAHLLNTLIVELEVDPKTFCS